LFVAHFPFIKFPVAFPRAVEHEVEVQAGQAQISATLLLIVFGEIETEERLDVQQYRSTTLHPFPQVVETKGERVLAKDSIPIIRY